MRALTDTMNGQGYAVDSWRVGNTRHDNGGEQVDPLTLAVWPDGEGSFREGLDNREGALIDDTTQGLAEGE